MRKIASEHPTIACALTLLTLACESGDPKVPTGVNPSDVATLEIVSGNDQQGFIETLLDEPLVVLARLESGSTAPGVELDFATQEGGGSASQHRKITDAQGLVSVTWTLGPLVGSQRLEVTLPGTSVPAAVFRAQAENVHFDKLDPPLREALSIYDSVSVIVLSRTQLLHGAGKFEAFTMANSGASRLSLRTQVVDDLKRMANQEQTSLLQELGSPADARTLWIANAVFATIEPNRVRKVSTSAGIKYMYLAEESPASFDEPGTVGEVLAPGSQTPFSTAGKTIPWNVERIGASTVWADIQTAGEGAVVAMIDFGTNYGHQDLRNNVWINVDEVPNNGRDDDANGYIDDYYGFDFSRGRAEVHIPGSPHGTYTSGIVVGDGSGGIVTGVAPRARLMILIPGGMFSVGFALQYAIENGADVATMSFSIPNLGNRRGFWRLMADHGLAAGLVLVSGAGNFQQTDPIPEQLRIPEGIPGVIAVGGVDENLELTSFSSLGPVDWSDVRFYNDHPSLTKPDVVAFPGPRYPLLDPSGSGYIDPNLSLRGNSFSGPHAAGIAALMLAAHPDLLAWEVKAIMEATARDLGSSGKDNQTGAGLIDGFAAVQEAMRRR